MDCVENIKNQSIDHPEIIIIGAGIAGIAAGNQLMKEGFSNFKIFEASDRIGGRIWTIVTDEDGSKVEMGANWIHGVENNPIYHIADENHLLKVKNKDKGFPGKNIFVDENAHVLSDKLVNEVDFVYGILLSQCKKFFVDNITCNDNASVGDYLEKMFDEKIFEEKFLHYCNKELSLRELIFGHRKLLECCISGCDSLNDLDLQDFGSYKDLPGIHHTIPPGFDTILDILSKDIPHGNIFLNSPVCSIHWNRNDSTCPVSVCLMNGDEYCAHHVIVTLSLGVLQKKCGDMFYPSLPSEKLLSINRLGFGLVNKVFLEFSQTVVCPDIIEINLMWDTLPDSADLRHSWYRKIYSFQVIHEHVLVGWLSGKEALYMESLTDEQVMEDCTNVLKRMLKKDIPYPIRIIRTKWGTNKYTLGSYSFIKVGSSQKHILELQKPLKTPGFSKPSVLFAGEATHPSFYSTAHGALLSGFREADRIVSMYHPISSEEQISEAIDDTGIEITF